MTRFSYLEPARWPRLETGLTAVAIDNRIRAPLVALIATIALSALLSVVALARLHGAQAAYVAASAQLRRDAPALAELETLRAQVADQTRLNDRFAAMRRANLAHADELVRIGNRLPAQVWLRSLRYEAGSFVLEGTSSHAADVGAAILALRAADPVTAPQLMWLHDDGNAAAAHVAYALRLRPQP